MLAEARALSAECISVLKNLSALSAECFGIPCVSPCTGECTLHCVWCGLDAGEHVPIHYAVLAVPLLPLLPRVDAGAEATRLLLRLVPRHGAVSVTPAQTAGAADAELALR